MLLTITILAISYYDSPSAFPLVKLALGRTLV